jgi:hypothetical protein
LEDKEETIKMNVKDIDCEDVNRIELAQDYLQFPALAVSMFILVF